MIQSKYILLFVFIVLVNQTLAQTEGILVHDLSTGIINGTTSSIAYGTQDDTWTVARPDRPGGFTTTYVCSTIGGSWDTENCGRWITPYLDGVYPSGDALVGEYKYRTSFMMDHHCFTWAKVTFTFVGGDDNITNFSLNGHNYILNPSTSTDFSPLTQNISFYVNPNHILIGVNRIVVHVYNSNYHTGFYACGNVSISYCPRPLLNDENGDGSFDRTPGNNSFNLFPNPSMDGRFSIILDEDIKEGKIDIIDIMGRKVRSINIHNEKSMYLVDLSDCPTRASIFTILLYSSNFVKTKRILIQ